MTFKKVVLAFVVMVLPVSCMATSHDPVASQHPDQHISQTKTNTTKTELSSRSLDPQPTPWMTFTATWYTPNEGRGNGLTTATGMPVSERVVAVDPSVIPLGSTIEIQFPDGHIAQKIAADVGGAVKGNIVDIFCWSEEQAIRNGRQRVKVRVIR